MITLRDLDQLPETLLGGAVAVGNFDGVHRGHARIVATLRQQAQQCGGPAILFTFDPHPVQLLRPQQSPPPLTWTERKAELLSRLEADALIAYPTTARLLMLEPEDFFQQLLCQSLRARAMVEGPNFFFGRQRRGDIRLLEQLCHRHGMKLEIVPPLVDDGQYVSSSRVRTELAAGRVELAARLLTEPYRIRGIVVHGARRGIALGVPTANLEGIDTLVPAHGIYAGRAFVAGTAWPAAIHIGPSPTFGEKTAKVEVHLIGFHGLLYGQPLEVDFLARLRDIQPFTSADDLVDQMRRDIDAARECVDARSRSQPSCPR